MKKLNRVESGVFVLKLNGSNRMT